MICNIRDDSPNNVAAALDNVLEALRSSELYAPHLLQHVREDKVVNDLVEGLMTVCMRPVSSYVSLDSSATVT